MSVRENVRRSSSSGGIPKGVVATTRPPGRRHSKPPVQHRPRVVDALEHLTHHHGVLEAAQPPGPEKVPMHQVDASAHILRLPGKQLACESKGVGVDVHPGDLYPAAREQNPQDALAAANVQHTRPSAFSGHPVDTAAEPVPCRTPRREDQDIPVRRGPAQVTSSRVPRQTIARPYLSVKSYQPRVIHRGGLANDRTTSSNPGRDPDCDEWTLAHRFINSLTPSAGMTDRVRGSDGFPPLRERGLGEPPSQSSPQMGEEARRGWGNRSGGDGFPPRIRYGAGFSRERRLGGRPSRFFGGDGEKRAGFKPAPTVGRRGGRGRGVTLTPEPLCMFMMAGQTVSWWRP